MNEVDGAVFKYDLKNPIIAQLILLASFIKLYLNNTPSDANRLHDNRPGATRTEKIPPASANRINLNLNAPFAKKEIKLLVLRPGSLFCVPRCIRPSLIWCSVQRAISRLLQLEHPFSLNDSRLVKRRKSCRKNLKFWFSFSQIKTNY